MNVLYLINHAGAGGSEKYLKIIFDKICTKENIKPILCYNEEGLLVSECKERNIDTVNISMNSPFDFKAARKLAKICHDKKIDIIHSQYLRENYIAILSKFFGNKAKIIYTCHFSEINSKKIKLMNKVFYKKLNKIIAISASVKESLIESGSPKNKIEIVYHGASIKTDEETSKANINKCKLKYVDKSEIDEKVIITSASRFSPEKGNVFFINAIEALYKEYLEKDREINFKVILANEGPNFERCKELVKEKGLDEVVQFIGYIKDGMDNFYLASDVYVTTSSSEGLSLAVLEALSYGVPNIITNVGGMKEIVNNKSNCGLGIEYGDIEELKDALNIMINNENKRYEYKNNTKKIVKEKFSLDDMLDKTLKIYKEV